MNDVSNYWPSLKLEILLTPYRPCSNENSFHNSWYCSPIYSSFIITLNAVNEFSPGVREQNNANNASGVIVQFIFKAFNMIPTKLYPKISIQNSKWSNHRLLILHSLTSPSDQRLGVANDSSRSAPHTNFTRTGGRTLVAEIGRFRLQQHWPPVRPCEVAIAFASASRTESRCANNHALVAEPLVDKLSSWDPL